MSTFVFNNQQLIEDVTRRLHQGTQPFRQFVPNVDVRWDALSHAFYGTPWLEEILVRANPNHIGQVFAPAGTTLIIPELGKVAWVDPNSLPPWDTRRQSRRR
ncbi:MAG: hypothetical protein ACHWZW_03025 [Spirulina sp.]